jgi:DNA-binding transcriptional regulator YdaS (Cro superfamily)
MEHKPRWAEMCAAILRQCEIVRGGRESLAEFLGVHPTQVAIWLAGKSGPPRAVFEKAMEIILAEHDRRAALEEAGPTPRRRRGETA